MQRRKGQSTLEYALIIAVVVSALLLMQHYVKRGVAGKLRSSSDEIGDQFDPARHSGVFDVASDSIVTSENNTAATGAGIQLTTYGDLGAGDGRTQSKTGTETTTKFDPVVDKLIW